MAIMKLPQVSIKNPKWRQGLVFGMVAAMFVGSAVCMIWNWPNALVKVVDVGSYPTDVRMDYAAITKALREFEARQSRTHIEVVSNHDLNLRLSLVQIDAASGHFTAARSDIHMLKQALANWNFELAGGTPNSIAGTGITLPILLYHYPPPNFEEQLVHLEQAGYTVIGLDEALAGLNGAPLPPKPAVITFDDGFEPQMQAFEILKRHHMKATYYIIDGGADSKWCIGAGRRYGDPLQPPSGCGDAYLTWDQVRTLDKSGIVTIGGHTINHRNLASLSAADQEYEIARGKEILEQKLGHSVIDFAYPYGAYNEESIRIAREAGYLTAVTTMPGDVQPAGAPFTLRRVRDAMVLP